MKKWLQVVATLAFAICAIVLVNVQDVSADTITSTDGNWEYEADYFNSICTVTDYFGDSENLVIPSKIDGLKVTKINSGKNYWNEAGSFFPKSIISVSMPETVTEIGSNSFKNLNNLRTVKLSSNLEYIGEDAFCDCDSLESITIPKSVKSIDGRAFEDCVALKKIIIEGDPDVFFAVFRDCINLEEVSCPKFTGTGAGRDMFEDCTSLKTVDMPKIQYVSEGMFYGCTSLNEFKYFGQLKSIKSYAFVNTSIEKVNLSSKLTYLGDKAFEGTKISTLIIPDSVDRGVSIGTDLNNTDIYVMNPVTGIDEVSQTCTIHGYKNSKAYEYAKNKGIRFVALKGISSAKGVKKGTKSVLSWKKVSGVKSYTIYRYNSSNGVYQKIATTKKNKYTDKSKSASYKYKITYTYNQEGKTLTGCTIVDVK